MIEVRSGRPFDALREVDERCEQAGRTLVTLHEHEGLYSGVWLTPSFHAEARKFLELHGITAAGRKAGP